MAKCLLLVGECGNYLDSQDTWLQRHNCALLQVTTAAEAVELAYRKPDLVLIGPGLPDGQPAEVCGRLTDALGPDGPPLLVLLEARTSDQAQACIEAGGTECLVQPVSKQRVMEHLAGALGYIPRIHYRAVVDFTVEGSTDGAAFVALCRNISVGGTLLESPVQVNEGDILSMALPILPKGERLDCRGRVVRAREAADGGWHLGIQFRRLTRKQRRFLRDFMARQR